VAIESLLVAIFSLLYSLLPTLLPTPYSLLYSLLYYLLLTLLPTLLPPNWAVFLFIGQFCYTWPVLLLWSLSPKIGQSSYFLTYNSNGYPIS
jgi:hypothetical protein